MPALETPTVLDTAIARHIWETRYCAVSADGVPDRDVDDSWRRVARAAAAVEVNPAAWAERFSTVLQDFRFVPAGRILAGAGTGRRTTLFNCFVMGRVEDDLAGIFDALKEGALTMQAGGGVGYDFSTLRPRGCRTLTSGRIASGPVSFLEIWNAMCATVLSTGARRGAMIASLRCDHPDVLDFVDAKRRRGTLSHFNLSVQVTREFMAAVDAGASWPLVFPARDLPADGSAGVVQRRWTAHPAAVPCRVFGELPARELWQRIVSAAYDSAEPGVLFVDAINEQNNLWYRETITTTNPCGEIPLPPYGACDLGSINLTRFVRNAFTPAACWDFDGLATTAAVAVRLLDNVIDCSPFPLPQQEEQARGSRRIGLGVTGLADALILLGLHYGSDAARGAARDAARCILHAAYRASIQAARDKGPFPYFEGDSHLRGRFIRSLPGDIAEAIRRHGIRNSHLTAIAPAGTISLLAGNISSGIEPVFDFCVRRRVLGKAGEVMEFELEDFAFRLWRQLGRDPATLPPEFVSARELSPLQHIDMQAALQELVDNAIAKTVNVPRDIPFESFAAIYRQAFERGLKGCTVYRPNELRGEVLSADGSHDSRGEPGLHCVDVHCCPPERQGD